MSSSWCWLVLLQEFSWGWGPGTLPGFPHTMVARSIPGEGQAKAILPYMIQPQKSLALLPPHSVRYKRVTKAWAGSMGAELDFTSWWKDGQRIGGHVSKPLQSAFWSEIIYFSHTWKIYSSLPKILLPQKVSSVMAGSGSGARLFLSKWGLGVHMRPWVEQLQCAVSLDLRSELKR